MVVVDILGIKERGQIKFIFDYNVRAHSVTQYFKRNEKFHPRQDRLNSDETLFLTQSGYEVILQLDAEKYGMSSQKLQSAREIAHGC